jgi:uncharacterized membrane protein
MGFLVSLTPSHMAEGKNESDVPKALQDNKKAKETADQVAQQKIDNEVKKGEAFLVAIGYISFLCVLPLVLLRDSKFAQFHGKQALVLAIFIYFFDVVQILPPLFASIYTVLKTFIVIYAIYMSFNAKYFKIPFIHSMSEKFDINIS